MASKPESLPELFDAVKAKFPASLEPERWYLVAVSKYVPLRTVLLLIFQASALVTCSDPFQFGQLYSYLTKQPEYVSQDRRRFLNKRLREFVMKQWVTIGVPKAATALFGLIKEEQAGDMDLTFSKYVSKRAFTSIAFVNGFPLIPTSMTYLVPPLLPKTKSCTSLQKKESHRSHRS